MSGALFLGTTTLKRMIKAICSKYDPLFKHVTFTACHTALMKVKDDPSYGETIVYAYYHSEEDETVMTTVEGDIWGNEDQAAGFKGKVELTRAAKDSVPAREWWMHNLPGDCRLKRRSRFKNENKHKNKK